MGFIKEIVTIEQFLWAKNLGIEHAVIIRDLLQDSLKGSW